MRSLFFLPLLFSLLQAAPGCPNGFLQHDNNCYALIRVKATWAEAVVYCQAVDSQLVQVESEVENNFLTNWLENESSTITGDGVWMAGHDFVVEGEYQWYGSGSKIQNMWWAPGDPNNDGDQDCILFWKQDNFKWDDGHCVKQEYFICEQEGDPSITDPIG